MQSCVVRVVVVEVCLVGHAAGLPNAVKHRGVHAEHALRLAVRISQTILDDASDHRHVLVDVHFTVDDGSLDEDGLAVGGCNA